MLDFMTIHCPACGEPQTLAVDASAGAQQYIEDCQVCCRPMNVDMTIDDDGDVHVRVSADGE